MFKIVAHQGRYCPRIFCDFCQKRIDDAGMALVMYRKSVGDGDVPFVIVHKGECDTAAQVLYDDAGGWTELGTAIAWLMQNVGIKTSQDRDRVFEVADIMASIG